MIKKFFVLFLFCIIALAISPGLYAQEKPSAALDYKNYLVVKGGVFYPEGDLSNLNTGFNGEIAYGYRFHTNGALELSSGYFGASNTFRESVLYFPISLKESVYAIPLTLAIKGIVPIDKQFELYGMAGGGAYFVNGKGTFSDSATVWGGFLGAGATYNITPQVFVGLEGKYLWTNSATLRGAIAGVPVNDDFKIEGILATANLGFRF